MATSEAEICNLAIRHLGINKEIADLTNDETETAQACRAFYDTTRDQVLRDFPWPFAKAYATLAGQVEEPNTDWGYSYRYPSDCLQARRILSGVRVETQEFKVTYQVGRDDDGLLIFTDDAAPVLEYTVREEDPTRFPPDFVMALSLRLAHYIAPALTGGDPFKLGDRALQLYGMEISQAMARASMEETYERPAESEWIEGR